MRESVSIHCGHTSFVSGDTIFITTHRVFRHGSTLGTEHLIVQLQLHTNFKQMQVAIFDIMENRILEKNI